MAEHEGEKMAEKIHGHDSSSKVEAVQKVLGGGKPQGPSKDATSDAKSPKRKQRSIATDKTSSKKEAQPSAAKKEKTATDETCSKKEAPPPVSEKKNQREKTATDETSSGKEAPPPVQAQGPSKDAMSDAKTKISLVVELFGLYNARLSDQIALLYERAPLSLRKEAAEESQKVAEKCIAAYEEVDTFLQHFRSADLVISSNDLLDITLSCADIRSLSYRCHLLEEKRKDARNYLYCMDDLDNARARLSELEQELVEMEGQHNLQ